MPDTKFASGERAKEMGRLGGIASGQARRARRTLRECLEARLEQEEANGMTAMELITDMLVRRALEGDAKAYCIIRDTLLKTSPAKDFLNFYMKALVATKSGGADDGENGEDDGAREAEIVEDDDEAGDEEDDDAVDAEIIEDDADDDGDDEDRARAFPQTRRKPEADDGDDDDAGTGDGDNRGASGNGGDSGAANPPGPQTGENEESAASASLQAEAGTSAVSEAVQAEADDEAADAAELKALKAELEAEKDWERRSSLKFTIRLLEQRIAIKAWEKKKGRGGRGILAVRGGRQPEF